ncbi:MAG: hypothetical protein PVI21_06540 [Candidatus Woesebacteria bacterium]|jgi:hypothetical protein
MKKSSRLEEYKKGYGLIRDGELNGLFKAHVIDLKNYIIDKQQLGGIYYQVRSIDANDKKIKLYQDIFTIEYSNDHATSTDKIISATTDFAHRFYEEHPNRTIVTIVYYIAAQFMHLNEQLPGILISAQTADGRCCMAWYKVITDDNDKIVDFEVIKKHIPKKHINDEDYEWDGNTAFFEEVDRLKTL